MPPCKHDLAPVTLVMADVRKVELLAVASLAVLAVLLHAELSIEPK